MAGSRSFSPKAKSENLASLSAQWAKGTFHPVYLLAGPDTLQKDEAVAVFQKHFLSGDTSGLNVDRFDGETAQAADILGAWRTMAFLGGRRLILVRRAQDLPKGEANLLAEGLASPPTGNTLILLWDDKADNLNVLVQAAKSAGIVAVFWAPFENQMPGWIQERAGILGKSMSFDAARALLDVVGPNLAELAQEVEKLALYAKDKKAIELSDVEAIAPESTSLQFLEFDRAFWRRDKGEILRMLEMRRSQGDPPEILLSHLVRIHRKLLSAKMLLAEKKATREEIGFQMLRVKMRDPQEEFLQAITAFSWDQLMGGMEKLLQTEWDLKSGRLDPDVGLTLLVSGLMR